MTPTTSPRGHRTRVGSGEAGASKQSRWIPGADQAVKLNRAAELRTAEVRAANPKARRVSRADLLRELTTWGLTRPVAEVRDQGDVPAAPDSAPLAEKSVTWVPEPGKLDALDKQAEKVGPKVKRNDVMRRHAAAFLAQFEGV
jgi:hypothetical protein